MMLNFDELLKQDLPSKSKAMMEGFGCDPSQKEGCNPTNKECGPGMEGSHMDDIEDDLNDIDLDGIDDDDIDDVTEDELAAIDDDDEDEEELSDDESIEADKNMAVVATPILLDDELTESAMMEDFMNEFPTMVAEGFLFESDIDRYLDTNMDDIFTEKKVFANKTRVQLDEKDRRKQLFEIGVQASARAHNDPTYWKLQKCYKLERIYKAKLRQKYRGEALKRVKAYVKRLKASSSGVLKKLSDKITGK